MSKKRYVSTTFWRDEYVSNLEYLISEIDNIILDNLSI